MELTSEDREEITRCMTEYKAQQVAVQEKSSTVNLPIAPNGQVANQELNNIIEQESTPDKKEEKKFRKSIRGLWKRWRGTTLDAKSLEIEKVACAIAVERAETQEKLNIIKRREELAEAQHWLELNKGNLEDIDANTTSRPSKFWYGLRRGFHHITKLTNNVPKIFKNLFWIGVLILGLVLLKNFNVL